MRMKPGPSVFVTVTFNEYAPAVDGIPAHGPDGMTKSRGIPAARGGAPKAPAGPRVSATRHGVTATKGSCPVRFVSTALSPSGEIRGIFAAAVACAEGDQSAGALQLRI